MSNYISEIANPIPASQIVNVKLKWGCLTAPTCTTLELSLQELVNAICELKNPDVDASSINPNSTELNDILQALIDKCNSENSTTTGTEEETSWDINTCLPDRWDCNAENNCIEVTDPCGTEVTNEEVIQSLVSRLISVQAQVKTLCEKIEELETKDAELQLQIDNSCCS